MRATPLQDIPPFSGHSPQQERALGGYAVLMTGFGGLASAFAVWYRRSGRPLPDTVSTRDLVLLTIATHKSSRMITKDRVNSVVRAPFTRFEGDAGPSEVSEAPRGRGLRRAVGELLVCPYCLGMWLGSGFLAGLLVAPKATRWIASAFVIVSGSDVLQIAYAKAEDAL